MREQYDDPTIDLTQVWGVAFLRWRIIATIMLATLAVWFLSVRVSGSDDHQVELPPVEPNTYTATAVFKLEADPTGEFTADEIARFTHAMTETYRVVMSSRATLTALAADISIDRTVEEISQAISVQITANTPFISVTAEDTDPATAMAIANRISVAFESIHDSGAFGLSGINLSVAEYEPAIDTKRNVT